MILVNQTTEKIPLHTQDIPASGELDISDLELMPEDYAKIMHEIEIDAILVKFAGVLQDKSHSASSIIKSLTVLQIKSESKETTIIDQSIAIGRVRQVKLTWEAGNQVITQTITKPYPYEIRGGQSTHQAESGDMISVYFHPIANSGAFGQISASVSQGVNVIPVSNIFAIPGLNFRPGAFAISFDPGFDHVYEVVDMDPEALTITLEKGVHANIIQSTPIYLRVIGALHNLELRQGEEFALPNLSQVYKGVETTNAITYKYEFATPRIDSGTIIFRQNEKI